MDCLTDPSTISCFPVLRKKRSNLRRRPHPNPKPITNYLTDPSSPTACGGHEAITLRYLDVNLYMGPDSERYNPPHGDHTTSYTNKHIGSDRLGNVKRLKKVKLKLGGVTRTLHTKPNTEVELGSGLLGIRSFDSTEQDFSRNNVFHAKDKSSRRHMDQVSDTIYKVGDKNKRAAKKVSMDEEFDDEDDEEIRYLKKLRASKAAYGYVDKQEENVRRSKGIAKRMNLDYNDTKDGIKKLRIYKKDNDYKLELSSDDELKSNRKRLTGDCVDPTEGEMTMTTRKRALECPEFGSVVEFPNGLPSAPSKKQKLSEVEQQLRKAEVAQRRRLQAEKAAKKAEAEAIRKILGQDSSRKKEEKLKKQQEELAQERIGKAAALGPNTVRWIMGPHGTVVTFSEDIGLPKILESMPCRYPPPREKCVGPNCTNVYKYRDSKSKLPLCSLHCYKAVRGNMDLLPAC